MPRGPLRLLQPLVAEPWVITEPKHHVLDETQCVKRLSFSHLATPWLANDSEPVSPSVGKQDDKDDDNGEMAGASIDDVSAVPTEIFLKTGSLGRSVNFLFDPLNETAAAADAVKFDAEPEMPSQHPGSIALNFMIPAESDANSQSPLDPTNSASRK